MLKRILGKIDWPRLLGEAGLGEVRLLREVQARLAAVETKFWQGKSLGEFSDNAVRMRATEVLADLLGKRKAELNLHADEIVIRAAPTPEQLGRLTDDELKTLHGLTEKLYSPAEDEGGA